MTRRIRRIVWLVFALVGIGILVSLPIIWGDLVYPLRYEETIMKASKEFDLPPSLIAGVIYTESHFNAQATSRVGARGLMQIMPATGQGIAVNLGDVSYNADKLYDPATNIRYGSYYLRELHDRYDNDIDLVLAAYNGGGAAANRHRAGEPIPLETSGFIVKVKRARDTYKQIYGEDLGSNIGENLRQPEPKTLWELIFGRLFSPKKTD